MRERESSSIPGTEVSGEAVSVRRSELSQTSAIRVSLILDPPKYKQRSLRGRACDCSEARYEEPDGKQPKIQISKEDDLL
jgi:hypothetical protein